MPLLYDPHFLESAFDRRVAVEALRSVLELTKFEEYAKDTIETLSGPKSESDEDLLDYWRQTGCSSWHMTGTAKMGRRGHEDAVVDSDFRVIGIDGLRVADMSVVPVLMSGHTQAAACEYTIRRPILFNLVFYFFEEIPKCKTVPHANCERVDLAGLTCAERILEKYYRSV